jgi:hypothetical protein
MQKITNHNKDGLVHCLRPPGLLRYARESLCEQICATY